VITDNVSTDLCNEIDENKNRLFIVKSAFSWKFNYYNQKVNEQSLAVHITFSRLHCA
jgi:hypothetical protein